MKLDILAFGAHPDDVELACVGTLINEIKKGHKVGVIDLTQGELGSRGTKETREAEASRASKIIGLDARENLKLADGFFKNDEASQVEVIKVIRKYRPEIIFSNAIHDRHPDHGKGADLLRDCYFLSGLRRIETELEGVKQEPWRPKTHYHYIQDQYIEPDFVVDVTDSWTKKMESVLAYSTQFTAPDAKVSSSDSEPQTYISTPHFSRFLEARAREFGHRIGVEYGEGFTVERTVGLDSVFDIK